MDPTTRPRRTQPSPAEVGPAPGAVVAPAPAAIDRAVRKGIDFLLADQNKNGSWGSAALNKGGIELYAPVPGAHHAFQSRRHRPVHRRADRNRRRPPRSHQQPIERGEAWLIDYLPKVRRADPTTLYNIWSHIYGIQAFVRMHQRLPDPDRRKKLEGLIREQIDFLMRYESVDKGWGYYDFRIGAKRPATDSTSFMTAAGPGRLARGQGHRHCGAADKLIAGAVDSIHRQRKPDFSYLYGEYLKYEPGHADQPAGRQPGPVAGVQHRACGCGATRRSPTRCMKTWLDRLFARNGWLDMGRKKPIPHESHFFGGGLLLLLRPLLRGPVHPPCPRQIGRSTRTTWRRCCCDCKARTARGGTSRCTTTTSNTAPRSR